MKDLEYMGNIAKRQRDDVIYDTGDESMITRNPFLRLVNERPPLLITFFINQRPGPLDRGH